MSDKVTVIGGAGVMGISAALALKGRHPDHAIYLINDGQQSIEPASEDICKVLRDKYKDKEYTKLAAEAIGLFSSDHMHQSGWITLHPSAEEQSIPAGLPISKEVFLDKFPGARLDNINKISEDTNVAWIEASKALQARLDLAKKCGVILIEAQVVDLLWEDLTCVGVKLGSGAELLASSVLLTMGHETASFLEQCKLPDMGGDRAGISLLGIQLSDGQYNMYQSMPILRMSGIGQIFPPNEEKIMKISNTRSFWVPDLSRLKANYPLSVASPFFNENLQLLSWLLPELKHCKPVLHRYCLDWVTRTQDFIISPVRDRSGLWVAYGGSFHAWKFLTIIGDYISRMMDGDETYAEDWKRWIDHSDLKALIHGEVIPKRSFPSE